MASSPAASSQLPLEALGSVNESENDQDERCEGRFSDDADESSAPTPKCDEPTSKLQSTEVVEAVKSPRTRKLRKTSSAKESTVKDAKRSSWDDDPLVVALLALDPILQFLTKATGKPLVPFQTLSKAVPSAKFQKHHVLSLENYGVLQLQGSVDDEAHLLVGFPPPPSLADPEANGRNNASLHGSTKTAAKRRLATLKRQLKQAPGKSPNQLPPPPSTPERRPRQDTPHCKDNFPASPTKDWSVPVMAEDDDSQNIEEELSAGQNTVEAKEALESLRNCFRFAEKANADKNSSEGSQPPQRLRKPTSRFVLNELLPRQAAFAGSTPAKSCQYSSLTPGCRRKIPLALMDAFSLERPGSCNTRKLYYHQAKAIESAMNGRHTLVCTGTGSGKSLCFLLPVLAAAATLGTASLLLFPTKALAQDQFSKLKSLLQNHPTLHSSIHPGILDGDTSHPERQRVTKTCNLILTNPDTLHAAVLPQWRGIYKTILDSIRYIVIDEAHMYEGVFGAHVAMVLSRMMRLLSVVGSTGPTFLACSATMTYPEQHFRLLCPIPTNDPITILAPEDDGSPRSAKHFFVWNPPIMDVIGNSTGRVTVPKPKQEDKNQPVQSIQLVATPESGFAESDGIALAGGIVDRAEDNETGNRPAVVTPSPRNSKRRKRFHHAGREVYRRHAADETALLLARAVSQGVRCIAFCKTRCLVEWVYERTIQNLKSNAESSHLANKVESYRGGYTREMRRSIETRLFQNELLGVVGTSALELGVDIGGIDLTLHCGYPSSLASLLQQAGRAGRGKERLDVPSLAIMVCFNSPAEQHLWRRPTHLLSRRLTAAISMPVNVGLVQGHLLCAGSEYPLTAQHSVSVLQATSGKDGHTQPNSSLLNDYNLFGSKRVFEEALDVLTATGMMKEETTPVASPQHETVSIFKTHPFVDKPWTKVSLRSIEPINYSIVDLSHPMQGGRMDGIHDQRAVLDTIPYSRVFYHAFPGAVIMHRGQRYKVQSMVRPPAFANNNAVYRGSCSLAAYAKPTSARYFTRPLSTLNVTVIKVMQRIDAIESSGSNSSPTTNVPETAYPDASESDWMLTKGSLAGNGAVTVRRNVHGYKKLSPITRAELSRTEISLPPMEFDTFAIWIDAEASILGDVVQDYGEGVHALSHALLAVAPLFVPCTTSDINCDHRTFACTRVCLFDMRAGGAGTCAQLWKFLFVPEGLLHAAVDLMENCTQCHHDNGYEGGCPACLHFGQCLKFNQGLSRSAALTIGKRMLKRIEATDLYKRNLAQLENDNDCVVLTKTKKKKQGELPPSPSRNKEKGSPRRKSREKAMRKAMELDSARERAMVVGRPSWPMDTNHASKAGSHVQAD